MWHVTHDTWHVTHDTWHVTCDTWHVTFRGPRGPSQGVWKGGPMRGLGSGHVTCGEDLSNARRCLLHRGQTYRQTYIQTDGHHNSMTESAKWANSVKIWIGSIFMHLFGCLVVWSVSMLGWHYCYSGLWRSSSHPTFLKFLSTFSVLSLYFLSTFLVLSQYFLSTLSKLSLYFEGTFSVLSHYFLSTFSVLS